MTPEASLGQEVEQLKGLSQLQMDHLKLMKKYNELLKEQSTVILGYEFIITSLKTGRTRSAIKKEVWKKMANIPKDGAWDAKAVKVLRALRRR